MTVSFVGYAFVSRAGLAMRSMSRARITSTYIRQLRSGLLGDAKKKPNEFSAGGLEHACTVGLVEHATGVLLQQVIRGSTSRCGGAEWHTPSLFYDYLKNTAASGRRR